MRTPCPTAGAAHAFVHFVYAHDNALGTCLGLFGTGDPTNPFVASQWGNVGPQCARGLVSSDCAFKIGRKCMRHTVITWIRQTFCHDRAQCSRHVRQATCDLQLGRRGSIPWLARGLVCVYRAPAPRRRAKISHRLL